jgi:hypothetical protein
MGSGNISGSLRPRSPVTAHRVQAAVQPQGRLSLTGNSGVHGRAVNGMQRQSPGLGRALSGSPPPSLVARVSGSGSQLAGPLSSRRSQATAAVAS